MTDTDMVIAELADGEAYWREVAVIKGELAVAGFDALRLAQIKIRRLQNDLERERGENARMREAIILRGVAA